MSKENKDFIVIVLLAIVMFLFFSFLRSEDERRNLAIGRHLELVKGQRYSVWVDCNEAEK